MTTRFLLVCEGISDTALISHIGRLMIHYGIYDPEGSSWDKKGTLVQRIRDAITYYESCDLLLVHRDADASRETRSAGPERRYAEIEGAVRASGFTGPWVGIVPVRMTESWLLLDEAAIRRIAGKPTGNDPLDLPALRRVESEPEPKGRLEKALILASGLSGRRLSRFERNFSAHRQQLLENLPVCGPLEQVPSWVRFRDDLLAASLLLQGQ